MGESYLVEVKQSVLSETTLSPVDFDPVSNLSLSEDQFDERIVMEFTSREDAKQWINQFGPDINRLRNGYLKIQTAHGMDESEVDAYLLFIPRD